MEPSNLKKNFLIIDDDALFRKIIKKRLGELFPENEICFVEAISLTQAEKLIKAFSNYIFELVIIDQNLPDGLGSDFLTQGFLNNTAVILMSSDDSPQLPGSAIRSGATYFIPKNLISEPFVKPLILGVIERNTLKNKLIESEIQIGVIESVKTLVATLKHEINNPLGAVLGATFLLKVNNLTTEERTKFIELVESSSQRIKLVVNEILAMIESKNLRSNQDRKTGLIRVKE